jgi:hypothetical protein
MKVPQPYKCDYCPKLKGESNHWWVRSLVVPDVRFVLLRWDDVPDPSDNLPSGEPAYEHICGQECAGKALAKWMAAQ